MYKIFLTKYVTVIITLHQMFVETTIEAFL